MNNFNQLEILIEEKSPEFIILSETHLTQTVDETETEIRGYNQFVSLSNSNRTGGVSMYIKKSWDVKKISETVFDSKVWMMAYMAQRSNYKFIITAVYRSQGSADSEFVEKFAEMIEDISEINCDIIITGDVNID